jgi:hypothetical protein
MVDLKPKRGRVDAIQSFASQETPIVRITNADGRQSILAGSESADPGNDRLRTLPCAFSADARGAAGRTVAGGASLERVKGIEPSYSAWKAAALPLSYTRAGAPAFKRGGTKRMGFFAIRRGEVNANPSPACGRRGCPQALTPGPSP